MHFLAGRVVWVRELFLTRGHRCGSTGKAGSRYKMSAPQHSIRLASPLPQEAPLSGGVHLQYLLRLTFTAADKRECLAISRSQLVQTQVISQHSNCSVIDDILQTPPRGWKWSRILKPRTVRSPTMTRSLVGFPIPKESSVATWKESPRMSWWLPTGRQLVSLPD